MTGEKRGPGRPRKHPLPGTGILPAPELASPTTRPSGAAGKAPASTPAPAPGKPTGGKTPPKKPTRPAATAAPASVPPLPPPPSVEELEAGEENPENPSAGKSRPPPFTERELVELEMLAGYGLTISQLAALKGFSAEGFRSRVNREESLRTALDRGRAKAASAVGQALFQRATIGGKDGPCIQAIKWFEMSRLGLAEKNKVDVNGSLDVVVTQMTPEERRRKIRAYELKLGKLKQSPHTEKPPREVEHDGIDSTGDELDSH